MRKVLFALTAASLLTMSGCATQQEAAKPAAPAISESAKAALAAAHSAVKDAKSKNALWTTAESALKAAEEAEKKGDSAAVISNAEKAKQHAEMGLKQSTYPTQQLKDL
jgi:murein lipoprotein